MMSQAKKVCLEYQIISIYLYVYKLLVDITINSPISYNFSFLSMVKQLLLINHFDHQNHYSQVIFLFLPTCYNKFYTFMLLLLVVIKPVIVEKNQIPAAAVWLDRENVPIKMFKVDQMKKFVKYRFLGLHLFLFFMRMMPKIQVR